MASTRAAKRLPVKFSDPFSAKGVARDADSNKDLLIKEDGAAQDLRLVVTLKEDAKKKSPILPSSKTRKCLATASTRWA